LPAASTNLPSYKAPAVAQFSLGVQHEIKPSLIWVVQYVGNLAWHQNIVNNINNFPSGIQLLLADNSTGPLHDVPGGRWRQPLSVQRRMQATLPQLRRRLHQRRRHSNAFRKFQGYAGITQEENTTNGNYNGFQTGLRIQNKWGLSGEVDYTWSHEIDLTTYDRTTVEQPLEPQVRQGIGRARSASDPQRQLRLQPAVLQQERRSRQVNPWRMGTRWHGYR
jgi:hypothetical protein